MTKRLFTAFPIHPQPPLLALFQELQRELKDENIKWVETHNMHITLWFFGDTEMKEIPGICDKLQQACLGISPFDVIVKGCGTFGPPKKPSVVWLGLEIPDILKQLFKQIKTELQSSGFQSEYNEYRPHLTLGRIKNVKDPDRLKTITAKLKNTEFQVTSVNSFILFESVLSPKGPTYTELKIFNLVN